MAEDGFKRKLTAILSADAEGYSRLMEQYEEATIRTLTTYRTAISDLVQQYRGRVVDTVGDNLMADFSSVVDSVNCAVEIQRELAKRNVKLPEERRMQFRIGVNLGDVVEEENRIYGDGINIAARMESMAEAGGICISGRVYDQVANKLGLKFEYLGEHQVKNISTPIRVYRVKMETDLSEGLVSEEHTALPLPDKPSIAVLPFNNMSGDPEQEFFSDGLTEQIITGFSKIPSLFVIARNSTFTYKGKAVKVQQVAQELGVRYVLEGSVQKSGDRVRINAQLIDATTGNHLWAESYDRVLEDIFAIQDSITIKLIEALNLKLIDKTHYHIEAGTENINAFIQVLQGLEYTFRITEGENFHARKCFEDAINLDKNYASAYVLIAWTHIIDIELGWSKPPLVSLEKAEKMALKSLSLDDSLDGGHSVLSQIYLHKRQFDKAVEEGQQALTLNPNNADHYAHLAKVFNFAGKPEDALALFEKSFRLNPIAPAPYYIYLATSYGLTGQFSEAIIAYKKALHLNPLYIWSHLGLAATYIAIGNEKKARREAGEVLKIDHKFSLDFIPNSVPYKDQSIPQKLIVLLRKAGLK